MSTPSAPDPAPCPDPASGTEQRIARLEAEIAGLRAELRASRESHERDHSALCAIADGIAIVDTQGRVTCVNPVASHLIGRKEEACLGRKLANVIQFRDDGDRSVDDLIEIADSMCYVAKDSGRNRVAIHGADGGHTMSLSRDVSHRPGARRD